MICLCFSSKSTKCSGLMGGISGNSTISSNLHVSCRLNFFANVLINAIEGSLLMLTGAVAN